MVKASNMGTIWSSSAVFVLEDDPQAGADHVDGHRSTTFIANPYAKRGVVNDAYYTQLNVVKTMEQILGVAPMNPEDRAAVKLTTPSAFSIGGVLATPNPPPPTPTCSTTSASP